MNYENQFELKFILFTLLILIDLLIVSIFKHYEY